MSESAKVVLMPEGHIIIRMDRDDYIFLQPGYDRLHLTPSQIIRLAMDRFLTDPTIGVAIPSLCRDRL